MKNLFFAVIGLITISAAAQNNPTNLVNLDITPTIGKERMMVDQLPDVLEVIITKRPLSSKVNVQLDASQSTAGINFAPRKNYFVVKGTKVGKRGKNNRIEFNSTAAALNYFKSMGYKLAGENGYTFLGKAHTGLLQILVSPFTATRGKKLLLSK